MTSTLPNFPASPAAAPVAGAGIINAPLLGGLSADSAAPATSDGILLEFASLLASGRAPAANVAVVQAAPTIASASEGAPTATHNFVIPVHAVSVEIPAVAAKGTPARPHGISREEYEHAAAFVAALLQSLQAAAPVPSEPIPTEPITAGTGTVETPSADGVGEVFAESAGVAPHDSVQLLLPNGRPFPTDLPAQAKPGFESRQTLKVSAPVPDETPAEPAAPTGNAASFVLPNGRPMPATLPAQAKVRFERAPLRVAVSAPEMVPPDLPLSATTEAATPATPVATAPATAAPAFAVAADGAIECTLRPAAKPAALPETPRAADVPMEIHAELELPGLAVVRVSAELPVAPEGTAVAFERPENFAAANEGKTNPEKIRVDVVERNFVFIGDKQVKTDSPVAGIAVAETENTMPVVPTEEARPPRNPEILSALPVRADFQVVQPTTERITAEPAAPAGQNFAERAVATVTSLADAQFSASMHRAGSVQLRLKFGGEDLAVRVELREGVVHTDFRTDSPALREALAREWQAVAAASPGQLQRFLDPVFSPASPSGSLSDSGAQQHPAHRQAQQQAQQEQQAHRADAWSSTSPFSRRSTLSEHFVPEPAAPRVPALLPTSLRLSALA